MSAQWKMVPVDPTAEMFAADAPPIEYPDDFAKMKYRRGIWKAMLDAAPAAPELPPLPDPHWPRGYFGSVPSGGYTADQMHEYGRAVLAAAKGKA
jgi:hypothetical protein